MPEAPPDEFDLVVLGGGPGGYAAALYGASAGHEHRHRRGAAARRHLPAPRLHPGQGAAADRRGAAHREGRGRVRRALVDARRSSSARRRCASRRSSTGSSAGSRSLLKGRKVTVVPGTGVLARRRPHGPRLRRHRGARPQRDHRDRLVAARARRRRASSSTARACSRPTTCSQLDRVPGARRGRRRRRDRLRVRVVPRRRRRRGHDPRGAAADARRRRPAGRANGRRARSPSAASRCRPACGSPASTAARPSSSCASRARTARSGSPVDQVVVSVGRRPRSEDIGLDAAGVKVDERGFVVVDGNMRTSVDGVYAVGDVVATPQLAHVAFSEGDRRDQDDARRGSPRRSTTTRCRGASTAIPRSRSAGSPRRRRTSAATTSRRRCTAGAATGAR